MGLDAILYKTLSFYTILYKISSFYSPMGLGGRANPWQADISMHQEKKIMVSMMTIFHFFFFYQSQNSSLDLLVNTGDRVVCPDLIGTLRACFKNCNAYKS